MTLRTFRSRLLLFAAVALSIGPLSLLAQDTKLAGSTSIVGRVVEVQGAVAIKGAGARRWTPLAADETAALVAGDWVRSDPVGANAVRLQLGAAGEPATVIALGPGSLLEVGGTGSAMLIRGEVTVTPGDGAEFKLGETAVAKRSVFRRAEADPTPSKVDQASPALRGFEGAAVTEMMGSLVAAIDGRDAPLAIGYHHVNVDVRDQVARTVIEQSFVNHTKEVLEGTFYFPLPPDASVSGFGMWIGDELVEADIVEKQRAREIYEIILHEKRDPGLLEWAGGSLFKARVYPIPAGGEKRIKITYTQVLPARGGAYHYDYALQSDLLKNNPLRELSISVRIHSALPLREVRCASHAEGARVQRTANAANIEFAVQNASPSRDFRVEVAFDAREKPVTFIPHQRGDDGYFLALINPPSDGGWQRELVRDGDPLEIIFLVDTSASVGAAARANQRAFIDALAGALAPDDRFNVIAFDNQAAKLWKKAKPATNKRRSAAIKFLDGRQSLGWSDIDRGLENAIGQLKKGADQHIIYLGDGVPVLGADSDPSAFANRLARKYAKAKTQIHAVATSAAREPLVLETMARLSAGGSVREALDPNGARKAAAELLVEISQPSLRNLAVEFRGLNAARVYPEKLPNLPAGAQQIVVGRFLPGGKGKGEGEVIVTGERDGQELRFSAPINLRGADVGNSFIPRLWARRHLDVLLGQGAAQEIRDEIIHLSERFKIMTPYTSLLVLESDADRERFKVKRRFHMRDGERYFAEGRDKASVELKRKHMELAGTWRLELRDQILTELEKQGRDVKLDASGKANRPSLFGLREQLAPVEFAPKIGEFGKHKVKKKPAAAKNPVALSVPEDSPSDPFSDRGGSDLFARKSYGDPFGSADGGGGGGGEVRFFAEESKSSEPPEEVFARERTKLPAPAKAAGGEVVPLRAGSVRSPNTSTTSSLSDPFGSGDNSRYSYGYDPPEIPQTVGGGFYGSGGGVFPATPANPTAFSLATSGDLSGFISFYITALPVVSSPPTNRVGIEDKEPPPPPQGTPEALVRLERALASRATKLAEAGVHLEFVSGERVLGQAVNPFEERRELISKGAWLSRDRSDWGPTVIEWCNADEHAIVSRTFELGTRRESVPAELDYPLPPTDKFYQSDFDSIRIEKRDGDLLTFVIGEEDVEGDYFERFVVDTKRQVILKTQEYGDGELYWEIENLDFVEVAGFWWPGRIIEREFESGETIGEYETLVEIQTLTKVEFDEAWNAETANLDGAFVFDLPLPEIDSAHDRVLRGAAGIADYLTINSQHVADDRWDEARASFEEVQARLGDKHAASRWLEIMFLNRAGDRQSTQKLVEAAARELVDAKQRPDELAIASFLAARLIYRSGDARALHDILKPVFARQPERAGGLREWRLRECELESSPERELRLVEGLADEFPDEIHIQLRLVTLLGENERRPEAIELLRELLANPDSIGDLRSDIRSLLDEMLLDEFRYDEHRELLAEWLEEGPDPWEDVHERHLEALVLDNDVAEADRLVRSWLTSPAPSEAGLEAAESYVTRSLFDSYDQKIAPEWLPLVEEMIKAQANDAKNLVRAYDEFYQYFGFNASGNRLAEHFNGLLKAADVETDTRLLTVYAFIASTHSDERQAPREAALALIEKQIAADKSSRDRAKRISFAKDIVSDSEKKLAFLDRVLPLLEPKDARKFFSDVFACLIGSDFSPQRLERALSLIDQIKNGAADDAKLIEHHKKINEWLFKRVRSNLYKREEAAIRKLSPREQRTAKARLQAQARGRLIKHLLAQRGRDEKEIPVPVRAWIDVEIAHQQLQLPNADHLSIAQRCMEVLEIRDRLGKLEPALIERAVRTVSYLAAENGLEAATAELRSWLEKQIAAEAENDRWKWHLLRLLVATDQTAELEKQLRAWIRPDRVNQGWRTLLAYLMAEQNRIPEAIAEAEALRKSEAGLDGDALMVLADWYLLVGDLENYHLALADGLDDSPSTVLNRLLGADGGFTGDSATPMVLAALVKKSVTENRALGWMVGLYQRTKDPRLLAGLPAALRGHTKEEVYQFLSLRVGAVTKLIYDEASTDVIAEALKKARDAAGDNQADSRALDLLELAVARRAAELANQPAPWIDRARAAMRRACDGDWQEGEREMMANLLIGLGKIEAVPLAVEQREQVRALYNDNDSDTAERLRLALIYAQLLINYDINQQAADLLEPHVVTETPEDSETERLTAAYRLVNAFEAMGQFARAEKVIEREALRGRADDWRFRRHGCWLGALEEGGTVSAGSGSELYEALRDVLQEELFDLPFEAREDHAELLLGTFEVALEKKIKIARRDAWAFLQKNFTGAKPRDAESYGDLIADLADGLAELIGKRQALTFLLDRADEEPAWMKLSGEGMWEYTEYEMAELRKGLLIGGEVEARMLAMASRETAESLAQGEVPEGEIFYHMSEFFWRSKRAHFADVAEKVARENLDDPDVVMAVGEFLLENLDLKKRAIALALAAIEAGTFEETEDPEIELEFGWELIELEEIDQAVLVIEGYLKKYPKSTPGWLGLMEAKFITNERDELPGLLAKAIATLGEKPGATQQSLVAEACLACELFADAAKAFEAALASHHATAGKVLRNDWVSGSYYEGLAKARAALGETGAAVEAISAALVSGPQRQDIRQRFIGTLTRILTEAEDLEKFVAAFNQAAAQSPTENPIMRRAIATAFMAHGKFDQAIHHLRSAIDYRPNDSGLRTKLIAALDGAKKPEIAAAELLELAAGDRKQPQRYRDLAHRYQQLGRAEEAERARASIVEIQPSEAANHRLLAELRQAQDRWDEAIAHWETAAELHATNPASLISLTEAYLHQQQWDAAKKTMQRLEKTVWPKRFEREVKKELKELGSALMKGQEAEDRTEE